MDHADQSDVAQYGWLLGLLEVVGSGCELEVVGCCSSVFQLDSLALPPPSYLAHRSCPSLQDPSLDLIIELALSDSLL